MKIIIAGDGKQIFTMRDVYSLSLMVNPEKQAAREIERLIKYPGYREIPLPKAVWRRTNRLLFGGASCEEWRYRTADRTG